VVLLCPTNNKALQNLAFIFLCLLIISFFIILLFKKQSARQRRFVTNKTYCVYTFDRFLELPLELQIDQLALHGISLDLACDLHGSEGVLFAYRDFYIELVVAKHTDDILCLKCFEGLDMLEPYLAQVDIDEVAPLLLCSR
jgi:hypothetical protein